MKQPDLGLKVAELRQQKNITQEQLAESCEVSTRTIQRIEKGEVDPRAYTLSMLSSTLDFDFEQDNTPNENLWLTLLHLSSMFVILILPLLIWSWKKTQSYKIDREGRQVLNFQITMTLVLFAAAALLVVAPVAMAITGFDGAGQGPGRSLFVLLTLCSGLPLVAAGAFCVYQGVVNAVRSLSDKAIHYPLSIQFVK